MSDDDPWLHQAPIEQLLCYDLRHAWPRSAARPGARKPPRGEQVTWSRIAESGEWERVMWCTGGCGLRRVETFQVLTSGALRRTSMKYRRPAGYGRSRPDADTPLQPLDTEVLRGAIMTRMFPRLKW